MIVRSLKVRSRTIPGTSKYITCMSFDPGEDNFFTSIRIARVSDNAESGAGLSFHFLTA